MTNYRPIVDNLFAQTRARRGELDENPVTGTKFVRGVDPLAPQKRIACRALIARDYFDWAYPGLRPLPLSYEECEEIKFLSSIDFMLVAFARSVAAFDFNITRHPSYDWFGRGVLVSPYTPSRIKADLELRKRFAPPSELPGLDAGLRWSPPSPRK